MARAERLKRRMLREAVEENLEILKGGPPKGLRPGRRRLKTALRALAILVVPAALFVSINAFSGGGSIRTEVLVVSPPAAPTPDAAPKPQHLPAPRPVDPTLFRLEVKTIVLDPGHGGSDPGATTRLGLTEKELTLDVGQRLRSLLEQAQFRVVMTREKDTSLSLNERAQLANLAKGDLFVSIHVNSMPAQNRRGVETFVLGDTDDPEIRRLASEENRGSGYSLSDFRRLLEGVYVGVRQGESRKCAEAVQAALVSSLKPKDPDLQNRGVKHAPFVVLVATEMPGVLAEVSCVSNEDEARRLADPEHRQAIARALFNGVRAYADSRNRPERRGADS